MILVLWFFAIVRHLLDGPALRRAEQRVTEALAQAERAEQGRREALAELAALRAERGANRPADFEAKVRAISELLDQNRTDEARAELDALAALVGEGDREVIGLRTMLHFLATPVSDDARIAGGPPVASPEAAEQAWHDENAASLAAIHAEEAEPTPRTGDAVVLVREPFVPNPKVVRETLDLLVRAREQELRQQLTRAQRNNHARNVALDALHFVWCDGGCDTGVHRFDGAGPDAVTREVVEAAIRNTERLIAWYQTRERQAGHPIIRTTWEEAARRPRVGLSVLLRRRSDGALLFGLRKGAHGAGTWAPPGGHLEPDESIAAGAVRELEEEAGADPTQITSLEILDVFTHDRDIGPVPFITLYVVAEIEDFEPQLREPDKCVEWRWVRPRAPKPAPLFGPIQRLVARGVDPHTAHLLPRIEP